MLLEFLFVLMTFVMATTSFNTNSIDNSNIDPHEANHNNDDNIATVNYLKYNYVIVTGCRNKNSVSIIWYLHRLGVPVICTTQNLAKFNYSTIPSDVEVYEI